MCSPLRRSGVESASDPQGLPELQESLEVWGIVFEAWGTRQEGYVTAR